MKIIIDYNIIKYIFFLIILKIIILCPIYMYSTNPTDVRLDLIYVRGIFISILALFAIFSNSCNKARSSFRGASSSIRVIERSLSLAARLQLLETASHAIARYIEECVRNCFQLSFQLRQRTSLLILFRYIYFHYLLMENRIQLHHTILHYGFQLIGTLYIARRHRSIIIGRKIILKSALQWMLGI